MYKQQIQDLLSKMTVEEKIGQLQQCGISLVGTFEVSFEELLDMMFDGRISKQEFDQLMSTTKQDFHEEDLKRGKIGSYNGVGDSATANRLQKIAVEQTRLGIPLLFGYDVVHGFRTITPIPLAESCAWEPELWEKTARMAADEATAGGVHITFAPMVDVSKDARWGRISESAGEDVFLNSLYGSAKVRGFQGDNLSNPNSMVACVKHFAAYGAVESGKDYNRVDMSMQRLFEEYLPSYKSCIDAGARAIMPAFNDINGIPCSVNKWLLKDILRQKWGFSGITISDSNAIAECVNHGIVADRKMAAKEALEAGIEMDMTSGVYTENLLELVQNGEVEQQTLDKAVSDILQIKFELGLFDNPYQTDEQREKETMLKPEYRKLAREVAQKSIVLLKNEPVLKNKKILPLQKEMKLGIFGELATNQGEMTGAWAIGAKTEDCISIVQSCKLRNIPFEYHSGITENNIDAEQIQKIAQQSDILIVALGESKEQSGEAASCADITLPSQQIELLECLIKTKKPVVLILFNGRPLVLPHVDAPAILECWQLGVEAGNAILDILYGEVNPSGKLTTTFPYTTGQCPIYYSHINTGRPGGKSKFTSKYLDTPLEPLYPFGYGLSYTEFEYSNLKVKKDNKSFKVNVDIKNVGEFDGEEIVQCYVQDVVAKRVRPVKQLKAFDKKYIAVGETVNAEFTILIEDLGYYDWDMNYILESGEFIFYVGGDSKNTLNKKVVL